MFKNRVSRFFKSLQNLFWVSQAFFRGKVLCQKAYQFQVYGSHLRVPMVKTTSYRINKLAQWWGYRIIRMNELKWIVGEAKKASTAWGDNFGYILDARWNSEWPKVGHYVEGNGTHGEALLCDPPHFAFIKLKETFPDY